jgi:hypothetical protein
MFASITGKARASRRGSLTQFKARTTAEPLVERLEGRELMATGVGPFHAGHFAVVNFREVRALIRYDHLRRFDMALSKHSLRSATVFGSPPVLSHVASHLVSANTPMQVATQVSTSAPGTTVSYQPTVISTGTSGSGPSSSPIVPITIPVGTSNPPTEVLYGLGISSASTSTGSSSASTGSSSSPIVPITIPVGTSNPPTEVLYGLGTLRGSTPSEGSL